MLFDYSLNWCAVQNEIVIVKKMAGATAILDDVFVEIGEIGPNQIVTFVLLFVLNLLSGTSTVNYMISAGNLDYR